MDEYHNEENTAIEIVAARPCVICGYDIQLSNLRDQRQICRECAGRIKNLIYPKGECW